MPRGKKMARLRIKEIAESKGYNMSRLHRAADIAFTTVKRVWQNPDSSVTLETLEKIARVLGVPVQELFEPEAKEKEEREDTN